MLPDTSGAHQAEEPESAGGINAGVVPRQFEALPIHALRVPLWCVAFVAASFVFVQAQSSVLRGDYRPLFPIVTAEAVFLGLLGLLTFWFVFASSGWLVRIAVVLASLAALGVLWNAVFEPPLGRTGGLVPVGMPYLVGLLVVLSGLRFCGVRLVPRAGAPIREVTERALVRFSIRDAMLCTAAIAALLASGASLRPSLPAMPLRGYVDNGVFGLLCSMVALAGFWACLGTARLSFRILGLLAAAPAAGLAAVLYWGWDLRDPENWYPVWITSGLGIFIVCYLVLLRLVGWSSVMRLPGPSLSE